MIGRASNYRAFTTLGGDVLDAERNGGKEGDDDDVDDDGARMTMVEQSTMAIRSTNKRN